MVNFIQFSSLSGVHSDEPVCSILEIDHAKILLDCGWEPPFDPEILKSLKKYAKDIDCVLLSHGTLRHCGGLVYACTALGLTCPIYATFPVQIIGKFNVLEALLNLRHQSGFSLFQPSDVHRVFSKISLLKYSQPQTLSGKTQDIVITAYMAGHTVGGTLWKLKKNTEEIVYAMDLHHRKERHLAPSLLFSSGSAPPILRPSVFILGCRFSKPVPTKTRDHQFVETVVSTLQQGGDVLIAMDMARWFEMAYVLDTAWSDHGYRYPVYCVSHVGEHVVRAAAGMLEWFSASLTHQFSITRASPFDWAAITFTNDVAWVLHQRGPKVVLATDVGLGMGPAWDVFVHFHEHPLHRIVVPLAVPPGSLAAALAARIDTPGPWEVPWTSMMRVKKSRVVPIDTSQDVASASSAQLAGGEAPFTKAEEQSDALKNNNNKDKDKEGNKDEKERVHESNDDDEDDDDEDDEGLSGSHHAHRHWPGFQGHDAFVYIHPRVFPYTDVRRRWDDYGELFQSHEDISQQQRLDPEQSGGGQPPPTFAPSSSSSSSSSSTSAMEGTPGHVHGPESHLFADDAVVSLNPNDTMEEVEYQPTPITLQVRCGVSFMDMNGLWDERSCTTMLSQVHAHHCILLSRTASVLSTLCAAFPEYAMHAPELGVALNVSSAKDVVQVKLTDALTTSMEMQKYQGYELGWVHAHVHCDGSAASGVPPRLDVVMHHASDMNNALVIGQLKLSEFKWVLDQHDGLHTQFRDGVLVVNNKIGIYKVNDGEVRLEGQVCKEYYQVRDLLYKQHVMF